MMAKQQKSGKIGLDEIYTTGSDEKFKEEIRVIRKTFNTILDVLRGERSLQPTNLNTSPTSLDRQLALNL